MTPRVKQFELADGEPFDYEPGQHTQLHFDSDEEWVGRTEHVQKHVEDIVPDHESIDFYCCGVPGMVVETTEELEDIGHPEEQIYSEG